MFKIRRWHSAPLLLCGLLATTVYGNGINPPRPSGARTVEAICTDRKSGDTTTLQRARIAVDEPTGSLEVRVGASAAKVLQLSQIVRVKIPSPRLASDGFAKASLELLEPSYNGPGFVKLRARGKPVRLTGFTADLDRVEMPLVTCKELALKASQPSEAQRGGVSKK